MTICANCSQPIRLSTGPRWWHVDTGLERCAMEFFAIPSRHIREGVASASRAFQMDSERIPHGFQTE